MSLLSAIQPGYSTAGFVVGLLVGLTGVGGGSLMTPLLVLLFGIHPATAVGTDLLFAACTKVAGTLTHGLVKTVEWRLVGLLAAGSLPAAALTLVELVRLGAPSDSVSHVVSVALGVALMLTALSLLLRRQLLDWMANRVGEPSPGRAALLTVLTGAMLGVLVSISSVGAGALGVTILLMLHPRLPTARVVGSDVAHAVPLTLLAGAGHWLIGSVDGGLLGSLLVGSVPGVVIGGLLAARVSERLLRPALAAVLVLAGSKLVA